MKSNIQLHGGIRRYLLGRSSSDDAAHVEERLLTDNEFYQELLVAEDELLDQYLAGQLTDSEKQSFENHFLATPERREKLRFARNLRKYINLTAESGSNVARDDAASEPNARVTPPPPTQRRLWSWPRPILSYSLAAAAVLVLAFVAVLIIRNPNAPQVPGKVLAVELVPGLSRGDDEIKKVTVTPDTTTVELNLRIPNDLYYQTYRAVLQTSAGREISTYNELHRDAASSDRIICPVSAQLLTPGDFSLKLSGLNQQAEHEDIARYYFRVRRY